MLFIKKKLENLQKMKLKLNMKLISPKEMLEIEDEVHLYTVDYKKGFKRLITERKNEMCKISVPKTAFSLKTNETIIKNKYNILY